VKTRRRESAGIGKRADRRIIGASSVPCADGFVPQGGIMDLAMAMGVTLFGLFVGSSAWFFHRVKR
jgi:hypothetical protein